MWKCYHLILCSLHSLTWGHMPGSPILLHIIFWAFFSVLFIFLGEPLKGPIYHLTNQHNGIEWRSPQRPCPHVASPKWLSVNYLHMPNTESSHLLSITKQMKQSGNALPFFLLSGNKSKPLEFSVWWLKAFWLFPLKVYKCNTVKQKTKKTRFYMSWSLMYIQKMLLNARNIAILTVPPGWLIRLQLCIISLLKIHEWTDSWSTWRQEWLELPKETKSTFFPLVQMIYKSHSRQTLSSIFIYWLLWIYFRILYVALFFFAVHIWLPSYPSLEHCAIYYTISLSS